MASSVQPGRKSSFQMGQWTKGISVHARLGRGRLGRCWCQSQLTPIFLGMNFEAWNAWTATETGISPKDVPIETRNHSLKESGSIWTESSHRPISAFVSKIFKVQTSWPAQWHLCASKFAFLKGQWYCAFQQLASCLGAMPWLGAPAQGFFAKFWWRIGLVRAITASMPACWLIDYLSSIFAAFIYLIYLPICLSVHASCHMLEVERRQAVQLVLRFFNIWQFESKPMEAPCEHQKRLANGCSYTNIYTLYMSYAICIYIYIIFRLYGRTW